MRQITMQIQLWTKKDYFLELEFNDYKIYSLLLKEVNVATGQEETRLCF